MKEESTLCYLKNKKLVYQEHDKIFKKILGDKKEAASFISKTLQLTCSIQENELENYNIEFIIRVTGLSKEEIEKL